VPIEVKNKVSEQQKENLSKANNETFRASRTLLNKEVQKAKNRSEYKKVVGIMELIQKRPCKAWKKMWSLQAGHNSHHQMNQVVYFAQGGTKATSDKENMFAAILKKCSTGSPHSIQQ
jgi:hypothetical protein